MSTIEIIINLLQTFSLVVLAYLTYKYAIKKMKRESVENIERKKYESILLSYQQIYQLLAYTTDTENPKSILIWDKNAEEKAGIRYFIRKENLNEFLKELPIYYYDKGCGLFLSKEVSALLFEYRSILYGFSLATKANEKSIIEVENIEMVKRMIEIHQELVNQIRNNINLQRRDLILN